MPEVHFLLAFAAGFLSFISPCCLPIYPAFLSYITGMSISEVKLEKVMLQSRAMFHTICFLLGFSIIFIAIGFGTSYLGRLFLSNQDVIRQLGSLLIIFFGLFVVGFLRPSVLLRDHRFTFKNRPSGFIGSALIGMAFAAGWTPCAGPILGGVIYLATIEPGSAMLYMFAYVIGFSIPFFVLSFFIGKLTWFRRKSKTMMKSGGYMMIGMGVVLYFDWMRQITYWLSPLFRGFTGF